MVLVFTRSGSRLYAFSLLIKWQLLRTSTVQSLRRLSDSDGSDATEKLIAMHSLKFEICGFRNILKGIGVSHIELGKTSTFAGLSFDDENLVHRDTMVCFAFYQERCVGWVAQFFLLPLSVGQ